MKIRQVVTVIAVHVPDEATDESIGASVEEGVTILRTDPSHHIDVIDVEVLQVQDEEGITLIDGAEVPR
jgi:hypothetical protein